MTLRCVDFVRLRPRAASIRWLCVAAGGAGQPPSRDPSMSRQRKGVTADCSDEDENYGAWPGMPLTQGSVCFRPANDPQEALRMGDSFHYMRAFHAYEVAEAPRTATAFGGAAPSARPRSRSQESKGKRPCVTRQEAQSPTQLARQATTRRVQAATPTQGGEEAPTTATARHVHARAPSHSGIEPAARAQNPAACLVRGGGGPTKRHAEDPRATGAASTAGGLAQQAACPWQGAGSDSDDDSLVRFAKNLPHLQQEDVALLALPAAQTSNREKLLGGTAPQEAHTTGAAAQQGNNVPEWVRDAFLQTDGVQLVFLRLSPSTQRSISALPPLLTDTLLRSAVVSPGTWADLDAAMEAKITDAKRVMQSVATSESRCQGAPPRRQPST